MKKKKGPKKISPRKVSPVVTLSRPRKKIAGHKPAFREISGLIQSARQRAYQAVNTALIDLYWRVGAYISRKLATAAWGEGTVDQLARYLARTQPELKGFSRRGLFGCGNSTTLIPAHQKSRHC